MNIADSGREYMWCAGLSSKTRTRSYEGEDDGTLEQLVLKRACLGPTAKDQERNVVEVTSFDHQQKKVQACICSLQVGLKEDTTLSDITIYPPAIFTLVEGSGPVHLVGNHMLLEEDDTYSDGMDSEEEEEEEERIKELKSSNRVGSKKQSTVTQDDDDDDDSEFEDLDDEFDDDDDEEEEEEEAPPVSKKRKLPLNNENKTPKTERQQKKMKPNPPASPKTPLQQKQNKSFQSSGKKKRASKA